MKRFKVQPPCGTYSGYDYHVRQEFSEPCDPCREAMKIHWRTKRIERKKQINEKRKQWRQDEKFYHGQNAKRLLKGAIQEPYTYKQVLDVYGTMCHLCSKRINLNGAIRNI